MLTQRQKMAIRIIAYLKTETGRYPGYEGLAIALGLSRGNTHDMVSRLIERGYLRRIGRGYEFNPAKCFLARVIKFDDRCDATQPLGSYLIEVLPKGTNEKGPVLQDESLCSVA